MRKCYRRQDCIGACGTSQTAKEVMSNHEYIRYKRKKDELMEQYFFYAEQSEFANQLMSKKVLLEICKFENIEKAWKKLNEIEELIEQLRNI